MMIEIIFMVWVLAIMLLATASCILYADRYQVFPQDLWLFYFRSYTLAIYLAAYIWTWALSWYWVIFQFYVVVDEGHRDRSGPTIAFQKLAISYCVIFCMNVISFSVLAEVQVPVSNFCFASPSLHRTRVSVVKVLAETPLLGALWDLLGLPWYTHIWFTTTSSPPKKNQSGESSSMCVVCHEEKTQLIGCVACKLCGNVFHKSCIDLWIQRCKQERIQPNCPTCRYAVPNLCSSPFYVELR